MNRAKIVSGGQTGVDRAALDAAMQSGYATGGWCPSRRLAEDGQIEPRYPLVETPTSDYSERTLWNVRDSDATLIIARGELTGGTLQTAEFARDLRKPLFIADLSRQAPAEGFCAFLESNRVGILNVAGPRESTCPGIYCEARAFLRSILGGETEE